MEGEADTSRILFINSADCQNTSGQPHLTTQFTLNLEDSIVVPPHHAIRFFLHRVTIPHTFYNFQKSRNCSLQVAFRHSGNTLSDVSVLDITIDDGNYNALSLLNLITTEINRWLDGATKSYYGTISSPVPVNYRGLNLFIRYNQSLLKYEWILRNVSYSPTTPTDSSFVIFKWESGSAKETTFKEEIGFIDNTWIDGVSYDFFLEYNRTATPSDNYRWGAITNDGAVVGDFHTLKELDSNDYPASMDYQDFAWEGVAEAGETLPTGETLTERKSVFSCVDVNFHIRSLYIRSNLTTHSVLDSQYGGRFSNILARLPNNSAGGESIELDPTDGEVHTLTLKVREIDFIDISLTDARGRLIDLNGLDWNFSLQFNIVYIAPRKKQLDLREKIEHRKYKKFLEDSGKKEEIEAFKRFEDNIKFSFEGVE